MFMIEIDPHKGSHTAAAVDRNESVIDTIRVDADRHQRARLLEWAARSSRARGQLRERPGWVRCSPSSSSPRASTWLICQRSCRHGFGCSSVARSTRPTRTTPAPPRSWVGAHRR